jgi:hypothetical protein
MSVGFRASNRVALPAGELLSRMTSTTHQEAISLAFGATSASATRSEPAAGRLEITLRTEEPSRNGAGSEVSVVATHWDLGTRSATWERQGGAHADRVKVSGTVRLIPAGPQACMLEEQGTIDIGIPLLGNAIAKKVAAALERRHPDKCRFWEQCG